MFTAKGASFGTDLLAANAVLFQIHYIMAYFFDGFANATSILVGKAVGSKDKELYKKTLTLSKQWSVITAFVIAGIYMDYFKNKLLRFLPIYQVLSNFQLPMENG